MRRYGLQYDRDRMSRGGMSPAGYGSEYRTGRGASRSMHGGGFRGALRYGGEYGGFGGRGEPREEMDRPGAFRGRGEAYDAYFRRDFMTNQGDFSPRFGGGEGYGYRGMTGREMRTGRFGGTERGYPGERGMERGYPGPSRPSERASYGPRHGERWESVHPEDIARRNFERGR